MKKATGKFVGSFAIIPVEGSEDIQLGYAFLKENWGKRICIRTNQSWS
jgi:hypothetical protein